ncbi:MAG: NUDIX hydrolase [Victivallales bacterium]|nr:NUDIX hydrolase [Victivallales bacterium]
METPLPKILSKDCIVSSKFVELGSIAWQDAHGNTRHWDCASRTGGHGHAVMIIARLMPERSLVLVRQFRPPAGKFCLEFPAGLVEPGEDLTSAALRELSEETGYTGKVVDTIPFGFSSAGLTDETIAGVVVEIDSEHYRDCPPQAHPEASEDIEVLLVPETTLRHFLQERLADGDGTDAKLLVYAYALSYLNQKS